MAKPKKPSKQPRLTKADLQKMDAAHIPYVLEAWESYHQAVLTLLEHGSGDEDLLEENRNFASYYYEVYLDMLIRMTKRKND